MGRSLPSPSLTARRLALVMALAVAGLAWATPASAQLAIGRSGTSTSRAFSSQEEVWREVWGFGICFARDKPREAIELLATAPGTEEEASVYKRLMKGDQSCLGSTTNLSAPLPMIRGAIAEGAYRRVSRRELAPVPQPVAAVQPVEVRNFGESIRCFVAGHAADVHALLYSAGPGSKKESAAVRALMPEYQRCLPNGLQFSMSATQLRFAFAEALYHATPAAAVVEK